MKSTRQKIEKSLLINPGSTIKEIAKFVQINEISARHHLTNLQAEGLVVAEEERHGVGRPRLLYRLSESGIEKFPSNYLMFTNRIINQLNTLLTQEQVDEFFTNLALKFVEDKKSHFLGLSLESRLDLLKEILSYEGYIIEWEELNGDYFIRNMNCPIHQISQKHHEVCLFDKTIMSILLSRKLSLQESISEGKTKCTYKIETEIVNE